MPALLTRNIAPAPVFDDMRNRFLDLLHDAKVTAPLDNFDISPLCFRSDVGEALLVDVDQIKICALARQFERDRSAIPDAAPVINAFFTPQLFHVASPTANGNERYLRKSRSSRAGEVAR